MKELDRISRGTSKFLLVHINYTKKNTSERTCAEARNVVSLGPAGAGGIQAQVGPLVVPLGAE